jgi:prepilin-type processing-associated H-X9-DG protein
MVAIRSCNSEYGCLDGKFVQYWVISDQANYFMLDGHIVGEPWGELESHVKGTSRRDLVTGFFRLDRTIQPGEYMPKELASCHEGK